MSTSSGPRQRGYHCHQYTRPCAMRHHPATQSSRLRLRPRPHTTNLRHTHTRLQTSLGRRTSENRKRTLERRLRRTDIRRERIALTHVTPRSFLHRQLARTALRIGPRPRHPPRGCPHCTLCRLARLWNRPDTRTPSNNLLMRCRPRVRASHWHMLLGTRNTISMLLLHNLRVSHPTLVSADRHSRHRHHLTRLDIRGKMGRGAA